MFLPPTSRFNPLTYPSTDKPYPPAILVKHHTWFLYDAGLFICCDHILYGVHQSHFDQSPLFWEIILYGRTNKIGVNPYHPIPFDTLTKRFSTTFFTFYISEPNIWNISLQKTGSHQTSFHRLAFSLSYRHHRSNTHYILKKTYSSTFSKYSELSASL
jgi:hypothetical protein